MTSVPGELATEVAVRPGDGAGDYLLRAWVPDGIFSLAAEADEATARAEHEALADRFMPVLARVPPAPARADVLGQLWAARQVAAAGGLGYLGALAGEFHDRAVLILLGIAAARLDLPDTVNSASLLAAMARHQYPGAIVEEFGTDHGGCFTDASLARTCAVLGIRLTHSQPARPMGRGKIERAFETIQQQFLVEVTGDEQDPARHPVADLGELNDLLDHWVRTVYHQRIHSETGASPQARYDAAGRAALPDPALLRQAFAWSAVRLVRKTATVDLEGNTYSVDPFLVGRKVELVFDPL